MRRSTIILSLLFLQSTLLAQRVDGLTGIHDTSYSIASEYQKHIRNYPYIQPVFYAASDSVKVEMGRVYDSVNGRVLKLDVFSPAFGKKKKKHPAILIVHGGGWRSGDKSMHHALAHALAKRGYVCITPEYRLSTEALYPAALHDLKTAVRWMRAHARELRIDSFHIAALGHSAGGQLVALMGATNRNPEFEGK
ncbi:MAG: alpha/beta hydrolase, partial [Chitinophagaceae bacterium]|nr:alpha/beta hydrolase [Chitinophagaceae bacterium]